ncbi:uncharacterized protein K460DRAFT_407924 [Cucurbitaria berberidis CBS 394.84]|uniref:Uncharacterized protein n=1 Tax=Cucurbitaria berberidis CBS 394.84 TaxID=1168544 RepID=A0A9P4GE46_9PLEO|nr:uncharacterized protein K460DRAFT_407924 [Cucurbitaria berberidis CBS 394.84]KAF1843579.1 hypothetical protein K460DRAFT_407924 [Cucurbitaria berberidis CBS 394.84]
MSSAVSSSTNPINSAARRYEIPLDESDPFDHINENNLFHSEAGRTLTRHCTSLQEHADLEHTPLTPRHESRRMEFSWGSDLPFEEQRRNSRNPLPPEQLGRKTPPSLEEIMRKPTNNDIDSVHNIGLQHTDSAESQPSSAHLSRSSSSLSDALTRTETRRSSIAAFAKGLARHIPDMRMFAPPTEKAADSLEGQKRRDSQDAVSIKGKRDRKPSFILLSAMKSKGSYENAPNPRPVIGETSRQPNTRPSTTQAHAKGSLRDRRKVKLDLSLPTEIPDLPGRTRPPAGALSSLTPARPRSPQTPWTRKEPPVWELSKFPRSAPIVEEVYIRDGIMGGENHGGLGLLPGHDPIFSQSPVFERSPPKVHDQCYISCSRVKRGRSDRSGTSESTVTRTSDGSRTPSDAKMLQEQQAHINEELHKLSQTTKASRSRRWPWRASSDDTPPSPEHTNNWYSLHAFKRSAGSPKEANDTNVKKQATTSSRPWRSKPTQLSQPNLSSSLAHMTLPPTFVPPGVNRVPTPPIFDAHGEVKGKLASFFFDVHSGPTGAPRRKPNSSSGGYWDSDALLMSLNTGIDANDEDSEEGPEGQPSYPHTPVDFETSSTPRLMATPGGYRGAEVPSPGMGMPSPVLEQDARLGVQHGETTDERAFNLLARKEEEDRRKFEWLVPEHLPNSPLCPLHPIYRGPCEGFCYWHGQKKSGERSLSREEEGSGNEWTEDRQRSEDYFEKMAKQRVDKANRDWQTGMFDTAVQGVKKRRLDSLSSP